MKTQPDPGALSIAPADGYQFGDEHPWDKKKQADLVSKLDDVLENALRRPAKKS